MSTTKPTILIVPGSFSPSSQYSTLITHLRNLGFPAFALQLPSTQKRMPLAPASMSDDASLIRRTVEAVLAQGKEIVVVAHSYGGTPTTQALGGLKVKNIVYLSAIVPKVGQTNVEAMGGEKGVLPMGMEDVQGYLHLDPVVMASACGNDMPYEQAYEYAIGLAHHSSASFLEPLTQAAYADVPVSYVLCEQDLVVVPDAQKGFIKVLEEGSGKEVRVVKLQSGHCPNWSRPEELANVLGELAVGE